MLLFYRHCSMITHEPDFDDAMMRLLRNKFLAEVGDVQTSQTTEGGLKAVAERAKIALSRSESYLASLASYGVKSGIPMDLDVEVTRQEYEGTLTRLLDRARDRVRQALKAGKVRPSAIDRVLLVGGTTYIPCVRELVAELFGKEPKADVDPDLAVCMGASIQAALIQGMIDDKKGIVLMDAPSYGLGVAVMQDIGGRGMLVYDSLIPPNTTIPFSAKSQYSLMHTEQEIVEVRLYQDQKGTAKLPEDAIDTGIYAVISDIPVSDAGRPHPIEVDFSYNKDHLVVLRVTIPTTGQEKEVEYAPSTMRMSPDEKVAATQRAANLSDAWKKNPKVRQYQSVIDKADQLLTHIPSAEMPSLSLAVTDLKAALATTDDGRIESCGDRLIDLIFDIETDA